MYSTAVDSIVFFFLIVNSMRLTTERACLSAVGSEKAILFGGIIQDRNSDWMPEDGPSERHRRGGAPWHHDDVTLAQN